MNTCGDLEVKKLLQADKDATSIQTLITPEVARILLSKFNSNNRVISKPKVELWKKSMLSEDGFSLSNDMVTFDSNGVLTNGQHRLTAVVESGVSVSFFVGFGVKNFMGMDTAKTRTVSDNARIFAECDERLRTEKAAVVHRVIRSALKFHLGVAKSGSLPQAEYLRCANAHADSLCACLDAGLFKVIKIKCASKTVSITSVAVFSAFLLAYERGVDIKVLSHIRDVLKTGVYTEPTDKPILGLREFLILTPGGGMTLDTLRHTATQACIHKVVKKSRCKKVETGNYYYLKRDFL